MFHLIKDYPDKLELINQKNPGVFQKDDSYNLEDFLNSQPNITNITYPVYILRNNKWYILNSSSDVAIYINDKFPVSHILNTNTHTIYNALFILPKIFPEELVKIICVKYAIHCAEYVLPVFENLNPKNNHLRLIIDAAKNWLNNPCDETRNAAYNISKIVYENIYSINSIINNNFVWNAYNTVVSTGYTTATPEYVNKYAADVNYYATYSVENKEIFIKDQKEFLIELINDVH